MKNVLDQMFPSVSNYCNGCHLLSHVHLHPLENNSFPRWALTANVLYTCLSSARPLWITSEGTPKSIDS